MDDTGSMNARYLGDGDVRIPALVKGDEILFVTSRGRVHAVRLTRDGVTLTTTKSGNVYAAVAGYRIHTTGPRSSFGNQRYFIFRADSMRKF
jgi:hypothetical protein